MKKVLFPLLAIVLALGLALPMATPVGAQTVLHVDDDGVQWPGAYTTIAAALAVAGTGDTIIVHEGVYTEAVVISKNDITLEADGEAVLDGTGLGAVDGITINNNVSGVTVQGFKIQNYRYGIVLWHYSNNSLIKENEVSATGSYGIYLRFSRPGNELIGNEVSGSGSHGIYLNYSHDNLVKENEVSATGRHGIFVEWSQRNLIKENEVSATTNAGIAFWRASSNEVIENKVSASGGHSINLQHSYSNDVIGNEVSGGLDGILVRGSTSEYNLIKENQVSASLWNGIELCAGASYNDVIENEVSGSGIYDLAWDGTGTDNVWEENQYGTSYPDPLP